MLKTLLGSSPRTTLLGIAKGCFIALLPVIQKDGFTIQNDWPYLVGGALMYIGGRVQKDSDGINRKEDVIVAKAATDGAIPPANDDKVL